MRTLGDDRGKLRLVVSSRKVLARVEKFTVATRLPSGRAVLNSRTANVYEYVLDERQERLLNDARVFASRSGLTLEVTDLSRQSVLKRLLGLGPWMTTAWPRPRLASSSASDAASEEGREEVSLAVCPP